MAGTDAFDQAASTWDNQDRRVVLAHAVGARIAQRVPLTGSEAALDFGCGTGLLGLCLRDRVGSLTGADTSSGMLSTLAAKAEALGLGVRCLLLHPEAALEPLEGPYDLIMSSMTLHHVPDVAGLCHRFYRNLRAGAWVALADLDAEDGQFHDDATGVFHQGFCREHVKAWLEAAGFEGIEIETATVTCKGNREYPVFLATGRKPEKA